MGKSLSVGCVATRPIKPILRMAYAGAKFLGWATGVTLFSYIFYMYSSVISRLIEKSIPRSEAKAWTPPLTSVRNHVVFSDHFYKSSIAAFFNELSQFFSRYKFINLSKYSCFALFLNARLWEMTSDLRDYISFISSSLFCSSSNLCKGSNT